ncbi:gustatory receptor for sugar taste 43a-like [Tenebrio molitor]|uniref:gustatory receptor for sugar taste 43a-like n=1 Tax=Tenebrio molitor TaxID=7067 RepID=UPI003624A2BE
MSRQQVLVNPKLFDILRPPFKLLRILGLCPATYHQHKNSYIIKWSQNTYIVNVTVTIILASWSIWGFVNDMQMASFGALGFTRKIDFVIASFDVSEVIFSALVFVTSTPFKLQHVLDAVDNLNQVDAAIEPILDEEIQKLCKFFQRFLLVFFPTICVIDLYMWGNNSWSGVNNYFAFYILYFIVVVHELQYWHFVTMTRVRLLAINQFVNRNLTKGVHLDQVFAITQSYQHVTEAIVRINKCFAIDVAMIILSCYLHLVICPYQLYVIVTSNETQILNYAYLIWISLHICRFLVIVEVSHRCTREMINLLFVAIKRKIVFSAYALPKISRQLILSVSKVKNLYVQFNSEILADGRLY